MDVREETTEKREKKKQGPKPGKVIRVDEAAWRLLAKKKKSGETISALIRRTLGIPPKKKTNETKTARTFFLLPESKIILDCSTIEEARGRAILYFLRKGKESNEKPIEVREVL